MEELEEVVVQYGMEAYEYLSHFSILVQLGTIAALFLPAWAIARWAEPRLEERARQIKDMPGLLRVIVAGIRRIQWGIYALLLSLAYVSFNIFELDSKLIYSAMLLSISWLLISMISVAIRSRALRKVFAFAAWIYVAASILGITDDVASLLDRAGFSFGRGEGMRISVLLILQSILVLGVAMWLSFSLGNFLDRRIQKVDELTPSLRVLLGKIARISLVFFAGLIAISSLGIDLTAFTVLSGAVGVGIGFGLQKVVSNFISGVIILLDQSIKPGDTISLGDTFGWIRELRARFVSVVTRDGREFLIPNEDFVTTQVINWSFSDRYVRLDVNFGVSYDSDPHEVIRLAIESTSAIDRVDSSIKPPVCWMTAFGDSSLDFKLRFWISDPQGGLTNIRGKVFLALWDTFKENGINIPFPHREVIMKTPVDIETKHSTGHVND